MNIVLLSGGSGKRLWPLSNDARSKQFLKVLSGKNGDLESMTQRVCSQLHQTGLLDNTVIATSKSQVEILKNQVGYDLPVVIEPERRDTFPAIALAASYIYSVKQSALSEIVTILPVDSYVDVEFFNQVNHLGNKINDSGADLALMGVRPTYPSAKYGYIIPESFKGDYHEVDHFIEKPSEEKAQELISQGALWNCGVFSFKLEYIISIMQEKGIPLDYQELLDNYSELYKNSFDYEVLEKASNIISIPYDGEWKDLGTWNTITEEMGASILGRGLLSEDSNNTHIINELDIPVTSLGINDAVIAASPDGILVTDKSSSPKLKNLLKNHEQRPMYEEKRWGWYKVLDFTKLDEEEVLTKRIKIRPGLNSSYQKHNERTESWTVIAGEGEVVLGKELFKIQAGDLINIPQGIFHSIKAFESGLELIEVQRGKEVHDGDVIRETFIWSDVLERIDEESRLEEKLT